MVQRQAFTVDFGLKTGGIVEFEGQRGLLFEGYSTRFNEIDQEGEWTEPMSFDNAAKTFFDTTNGPIPFLFHHGLDRTLSTKRIGRVVDWRVDEVGLWVKGFLPEPDANATDAVGAKLRQVWEGVRDGQIAGLSISGLFGKLGKAIKSVGLLEISVTPIPCLQSATFSLVSKSLPAVDELLGSTPTTHTLDLADPSAFVDGLQQILRGVKGNLIPMPGDPEYSATMGPLGAGVGANGSTYGSDGDGDADDEPCDCTCPGCSMTRAGGGLQVDIDGKSTTAIDVDGDYPSASYSLSRAAHGKAMAIALADKSIPLHDHLLGSYAPEGQGDHTSSSCPVCDYRRWVHGIKAAVSTKPWGKVDKSVLPRSSFLDQGEEGHPSTWRYPVYEGRGDKDSDGRYSERGPLNRNGVKAALSRAAQQHDDDILKKLAPLKDAAGLGDDQKTMGTKALVEGTAAPVVTPLALADLPARMGALAAMAVPLAELHATLARVAGTDGGDAILGSKAGRKLSKSSLKRLHDYHSAIRETLDEYGAWLEQQVPTSSTEPVSSHDGS